VDNGVHFYELEYLPHLSLNELFVHGNLPPIFWRRVFGLTEKLLGSFRGAVTLTPQQQDAVDRDFRQLVVDKTAQRLAAFVEISGDSLRCPVALNGMRLPSLGDIVRECQEASLELPALPGVVHGDLCFSNILYDSRSNALKVLDPRGINASSEFAIFGDLRYDVAKYMHSVMGLYDHIVGGLFTLSEPEPLHFQLDIHLEGSQVLVQNWFRDHVKLLGLPSAAVLPLVVLLFISMLPLHGDHAARQRALLANALRIYRLWKGV
jgi:hypothetical protein